jgi:hypothetical protein
VSAALLGRHRAGVAALVLVAVAAVLLLFAFDARAWQTSVRHDDVQFRALPGHTGLWKVSTLLPGDPAGLALGTGDTIAWRRALQAFWDTRIGTNPEAQKDLPALRAEAQQDLLRLMSTGSTAAERSAAANLMGVLVITTPVAGNNQDVVEQALRQTAGFFQQAVALDPANGEAKENLELVLRITRPGKGPIGKDAHAGFGFGRGHGSTQIGNGY